MVLVILASLASLAIGATLLLLKGRPRHLMVAALVPLAFLPSLLGAAASGAHLIRTFGQAAEDGGALLASTLVGVAQTALVGRASTLGLLLLLAVPVAVVGLFRPSDGSVGSRRAVALLLAPSLAVALALLLGWSEDRFVHAVSLVMMPEHLATPATDAEIRGLFPGTPPGEMPPVSRISDFLARQVLLHTFGGPALALAFILLAALAAVAGWRPPAGGSPRLVALGLAVALGIVGAWTASAQRRVGVLQAWADKVAVAAAARERAAAAPAPTPAAPAPSDAAQRCEAGDARACAAVGRGMGDAGRRDLYERVCAQKGGEVCADFASLHLNGGIGSAVDPARAQALYERACRTGDASACGLAEQLSTTGTIH